MASARVSSLESLGIPSSHCLSGAIGMEVPFGGRNNDVIGDSVAFERDFVQQGAASGLNRGPSAPGRNRHGGNAAAAQFGVVARVAGKFHEPRDPALQ